MVSFSGQDDRKVNRSCKDIEPQELFWDRLASRKEDISEKRFEVPVKDQKLWLLLGLFLIIALLLLGKAFTFQVLNHDRLLSQAEANQEKNFILKADRGVIYDQDMDQIVFNKGSFDLVCYPGDLPQAQQRRNKILRKVASISDQSLEKIKERINKSRFSRVLVAKDLSHEQLIKAKTELHGQPEIRILEDSVREYEYEELFAHLTGYTGKINQQELSQREGYSPLSFIGKTGLEKSYEQVLKGKAGAQKVNKTAVGKFLSKEVAVEPQPGKSLVLSIDKDFQQKIATTLQSTLDRVGSNQGVVVAMDPQNGEVLSLVSLPSYNPNLFSQGISTKQFREIQNSSDKSLFNRAIAGMGLPTGSTIKPLIATAALEEGIINANTTVHCKGKITVPNQYHPERVQVFRDWTTHGITDVRKAIAESCNVFFYTVGGGYQGFDGLGPEKIKKWLKKFGWGQRTGISLPSEGKGNLPEFNNQWTLGDTYHFSIGQGPVAIPPIQVVNSFTAIANGGTLYQPRLVTKIIDNNKNEIRETEPRIIKRNIASEESLEIVREGMKQGVTSPEGSSYILNELPVMAAAKTGTAETSRDNYYHNWVTVFAPYEDPEIVITVVVESVKDTQVVVLPVAKEVLNWYFKQEQ